MSRISEFESLWKKKKEEATASSSDISNNINMGNSNDFTIDKYKEMKKNGQVVYDNDIINSYFKMGQSYVNNVADNLSNPSYNWATSKASDYTKLVNNLNDNSDYVRLYINSLKGTDQYDALMEQYNSYNDAINNSSKTVKEINDFASQFDSEENYNSAIKEAENTEKYSGYSYEQLIDATSKTDDDSEKEWLNCKADEIVTSEQLQVEYDTLCEEYENLPTFNEEADLRKVEIEERLDVLEDLIGTKKAEEKQEEYTDILNNNIKVNTIIQKYYEIKHMNSPEQTTDTYAQSKGQMMSPEYSDEEIERIEGIYQNYKDEGFDMDTLYKYYSREVEEERNAARINNIKEEAQEHPIISVGSVIGNTYGSVGDAVIYMGAGIDQLMGGDGYIDPNSTSVAQAQAVREGVSENIDNPVSKFLYNTGMSIGDNIARLPVTALPGGKAINLAIAGTSAGVSSANTVIKNGGSLSNALKTGGAAAAAEIIFESIPLGKLIKLVDEGTESVTKAILEQMATEGLEEVGTDVVNAITDQLINNDMSQISLNYKNYIEHGYSEDEAWKMCAKDFGLQVGQSFLGGAISGGVLSGATSGINYATRKINNSKTGESIKSKENTEDLIKTAKNLSTDSKAYKLATKLEEQQKNGKKVSSSKVGKLRSLIIEQSKAEYDTIYKEATENLHEEEKAILDKTIRGESLTADENRTVSENAVLSKSIEKVQKADKKQWISENKATFSPFVSIDDNSVDKSKLNISKKGVTEINGNEYTGPMEVVKTNLQTGVVTYKIEENGEVSEVTSNDVSFGTEAEAYLNSVASKYNAKTAQTLLDLYEEGQDVADYSSEFNLYQNYGRLAIELTDDKMHVGHVLTSAQKLGAYEAGIESRKSYYQTQTIIANNAKKSKHYGYTEGTFNASAIKGVRLNETQKAFYDFFREFALRTGINVELFASKSVNGEYVGEQGSWNKKTGTIRVDINAGLKKVDENNIKHGMLNTFSHELTHVAEQGGFYDELHEAVVKAFEKQGNAFNELVDNKKKEILKTQPNAKSMSEEKLSYLADTEVIADACETMLKDSKIFEDIAQGNPLLAQKIKNALRDFINRIKEMLGSMKALTTEGAILEECVNDLEQIQKLWDKAVTEGIKTLNATKAEQKNNTANNGVQYQLRNYSEKQINNWSNSKNIIIYENENRLSDFVDKALEGENLNQKMYFGIVDDKLASRIYSDTNVNVEGFNVVLRASEIRKILLHSHGNEAKENSRGQRAITKEDILLIPKIIAEPDKIINAGYTKSNKPAIAFKKTIKGKTTVLSYVSDKHMDLTVQTMYSGKEKSLSTTADAKSPASTSETSSGTASNNSISNVSENVNDNKYQYAGRKSKTDNISMLQKAENMEKSGKDSETIRKETGWFRGLDNLWRYEIDDSNMDYSGATKQDIANSLKYIKNTLRYNELKEKISADTATSKEEQEFYDLDDTITKYETSKKLTDYLNHSELFEAYPQLKDIKLYFKHMKANGEYDSNLKAIILNPSRSYVQQKSTLMHEIQHAIQDIEGFAKGSSIDNIASYESYNRYKRTAGEIEAEDTAKRRDLSAEERKNIRPDIDRQDVVFKEEALKYQSRENSKKIYENKYKDLTQLDTEEIKVYNNYGWTYQLFTAEDYMLLNEKFNERNNLYKNRKDFTLGDGTKVVEVNNKLVLIGGTFEKPVIHNVFAVNSNNETDAEIIKDGVYFELEYYSRDKVSFSTLTEIASIDAGETFARNYRAEDFSYHKGQLDTGQRATLPDSFQNYGFTKQFQDRTGISESVGEGVPYEQINEVFQMRTDGTYSNRTLLANALESSAQNATELNLIKAYKEGISQLDELEAKLKEVNNEIKEISFTKGTDRSQLLKLNNQKKMLTNKIARKDKQLLKLESMDSMQKLIKVEKDKAIKRAEKKMHDTVSKIRQQERERDKRVYYSSSIRKSIKNIRKLLNNSKPSKTVKQDLREPTAKLLSISQYLFNKTISNADIVRKGVESATPEEQKLLDKYLEVVGETDRELTDVEKKEVYKLNSKLKDLFIREREAFNKQPVSNALAELIDAYESTKNSDDEAIRNAYDQNIAEKISDFKADIGGTLVKDMSLEQLEKFKNIVTMFYTSIRNANELFAENIKENCKQSSISIMNEIQSIRVSKEERNKVMSLIAEKIGWNNLKPVYAFRYIGSKTLLTFYDNLRNKEVVWAVDLSEAKEFKEAVEEKYDYSSFNFKKKAKFKSKNGSEFELTLNQMMDIYVGSRRPQVKQHLLQGGFVFRKGTVGSKFFKVKTGAKAYPLSEEIIQNISDQLSGNEKAYAVEMQKYLSTVMAEKGNEISMALYGVKLFNEENYWNISSSDVYTKTEETETKGVFSLLSSGFTKATVRNASNPIVLQGFEENWCNHVNEMSLYHALALPLHDITKVLNYKIGARDNTAPTGVKSVIKGAYGEASYNYLMNFLEDVNKGIQAKSRIDIADKLIALNKKTATSGNLSVLLQQYSAIFRATAYVNPMYFVRSTGGALSVHKHRKDWEQLKKYAPVARIKEMGSFDTGTSQGVIEWLSSGKRDSVSEKIAKISDKAFSFGPARVDQLAWIHLWKAIQRETYAKHGFAIGTEENLIKSGERFDEVVHLTQVYDSVFSRSGAMRSKQTYDKMATAFMAEPTTIMNMAVDAVVQAKRGGKAGKIQCAKTISALILSAFANELLHSLSTASKDEDEGESFKDKYVQGLISNLLNTVNPLNYFPFLKDVSSLLLGYDVERMDLALIADIIDACQKSMKDGATGDEIIDVISSLIALRGIPAPNVVREVRAIINTYKTITTNSKDIVSSLDNSIPQAYQEAYDRYWEEGYSEKDCEEKAETSVKAKIRTKLKPLYLESLKNGDFETVTAIRRYMSKSGYYDSLTDVDKILKGWREQGEEAEEREEIAQERK